MSTRVFNPLVMSEMRRIMSRNSNEALGSVDGTITRGKRNLFGPVNHEENLAFLDQELAAIRTRESERWGFDFVTETPLPNANPRFLWERVESQESIPEAYTLRHLTILNKQKNVEDAQETDSVDEQRPDHKTRSSNQSHITDFLKKRKRSASGDISQKRLELRKSNSMQISSHLSEPNSHKRTRTRKS
uniref:Cyclin-dependent kinase inhibitor domain-containing protein n=1 Tax=Clastoptera arizonana TaxID=38151 RepID=A0A1B6C733_9HEMI